MKSYAPVALCGIAALLASCLWSLGSSLAHEPSDDRDLFGQGERPIEGPRRAAPSSAALAAPPIAPGAPATPYAVKVIGVGRPDAMHEIRMTAEVLSEAEDDDAKADTDKKLSELLDDYFEEDMERREQELADVEARVHKLRELMERRRAKKDDIIELQKEVLVNEAEGLGFFNEGMPGGPHVPPGHPFIGRGTIHSEGGDVFRFALPPGADGPGAKVQKHRTFFERGKPRAGNKESKPAEESEDRGEKD